MPNTPLDTANVPQLEEQNPGLPTLVLEIRARLGVKAGPEQVAAEVRAVGYPNTSDEEVRQLWDEGICPNEPTVSHDRAHHLLPAQPDSPVQQIPQSDLLSRPA